MPRIRLGLDGVNHDVNVSGASVDVDGEAFDVIVMGDGPSVTVRVNGRPLEVEVLQATPTQVTVRVGDREHRIDVEGSIASAAPSVRPTAPSHLRELSGAIRAPMNGRIL